MLGPSQPKVTDEARDDRQIRSLLDREFTTEEGNDYCLLQAAYRHMRLEDIERLLSLFDAAGNNLNAKVAKGRTLWSDITDHKQGAEFIKARDRRV